MQEKTKSEKFIMLHVAKKDSSAFLEDAITNSDIERGLYVRSGCGKELINQFNKAKDKGYFPIGIVLDDSFNMEILFKRHINQTKEMKMVEINNVNPFDL
jgi:hypothetical protein